MEYNELVSVVMPVHNGERFLREAIESVLKQTYTKFELLIIENCSTDSSVEIIKSYKDSRIRLIIEEDCGQVQAYNRGFKEAKGDYIIIHDQDDTSHITRFKKQLNCMVKNDIDICGSYFTLINSQNKIISYQKKSLNDYEIKEALFYKTTALHNSGLCISKEVFVKNGYWDLKYYPVADCEFYIRAALLNFKFENLPEYLSNYRRHPLQITAKEKNKSLMKFRSIALNYLTKTHSSNRKVFYKYKGLIYYYTNNILFAFFYFLTAVILGEKSKKTLRYLFISFFFGIPLSVLRRTKYIENKYFENFKDIFNNI